MIDVVSLAKNRILVLDGAMGTMIQTYRLTEEDYRGERFKSHDHDIKGNNDILSITRPDIIEAILNGRQPYSLNLTDFMKPFPNSWEEQRQHFGF